MYQIRGVRSVVAASGGLVSCLVSASGVRPKCLAAPVRAAMFYYQVALRGSSILIDIGGGGTTT